MIGQTTILEKSVKCAAPITQSFLIARFGNADDTMAVATAVTDELIGVFQHTTTVAGEEVRVMLAGISRVRLGGTVARGNYITTDSSGRGVASTPGTGVNHNIIGKACASGSLGDIIPVFLCPGRIQG